MAIPYLSNINLNQNELQNARIQNLALPPASPVDGQIYYDTDDQRIWVYSDTAATWYLIPIVDNDTPTAEAVASTASVGTLSNAARADHRHAMPGLATGGSDGFLSAADKAKLDAATASPTASTLILRDGSGRAQVVDPAAAQDIATKNYVDMVATGLDAKASVRAATTANVTLSAPQTIDGVAVIAGDRVLVKNQTLPEQNGIYVVAAGSWTRSTDADSWTELVSAYTFVEEGTTQSDNGYVCISNAGGTLGTTAVTWTQFTGAGMITAGAGLTKTGNTLDVGAGLGITVNADDVQIDTSVVVRKYASSFGDGVAKTFVLTHSLGTRDVVVQCYQTSTPWQEVKLDVEATSTNTVTLRVSGSAPTTNQYRAVIHA